MSILSTLGEASPPSVAVELTASRVSAASLEFRGGRPVVTHYASAALPEGALVPSLTVANLRDRPAVAAALDTVFQRIGGRPRKVGLVLPDPVAKVSLVRFEHVPTRPRELDQLVRWQVRKAAPFAIDDAQVSYAAGLKADDGQEFVVSIARRDIVQEYESLCEELGAHAGLIDLATFNVINAVLAASPPSSADWLLVNVAGDYASIAILRGEDLIFFRNRGSDTDGSLTDLVHQTTMYYQDRLGGQGFDRVLAAGITGGGRQAAEVEQARRSLEDRLGTTVETVDPRAAASLADSIQEDPTQLDALAPLVGLLLRGQTVRTN